MAEGNPDPISSAFYETLIVYLTDKLPDKNQEEIIVLAQEIISLIDETPQ